MNLRIKYSLNALISLSLFVASPTHKSFANEGGEGSTANKQIQSKAKKKASVGGNARAIQKIDQDIKRLERRLREQRSELGFRRQEVIQLKEEIVEESAKSKSTSAKERRLKSRLKVLINEVEGIEASMEDLNRQLLKLEKERKKY